VSFLRQPPHPPGDQHCVSLYPTEDNELELNQVEFLCQRYPGHVIGLSTHEYHDWASSMLIGYAQGGPAASERHVDVRGGRRGRVALLLAATPDSTPGFKRSGWAQKMCGAPRPRKKRTPCEREIRYLDALVRGVYAKQDLRKGTSSPIVTCTWPSPCKKGKSPAAS